METILTAKSKKKQLKLEDLSREQIRQAILKKKECNAKAQKIVESLIEESVSADHLLHCLPDINQAHFDDIVEERVILHLCGYPICKNTISPKDLPQQKYRISLKTNKVYDITARKNFCSNSCYKSAMYVKQQLLTCPLWFRDHEVIPIFHLLPLDSAASMGQEVDLGVVEKVYIKPKIKSAFTSIHDFASASLNEELPDKAETDSNAKESNKTDQDEAVTKDVTNTPDECKNVQVINENKEINENVTEKPTHKEVKKPTPNPTNIVGEIIEKPEKKIDPILTQPIINPETSKPKVSPNKLPSVTGLVTEIEKCLSEWFTLDTVIFLYGEAKVREMVKGDSNNQDISETLSEYSKGTLYNCTDRYLQLCRKLNMLELEDMHADAKILQRQLRPLPDYSILQEESKRMQLKVRAFMTGEMEIPEPDACEKDKEIEDSNLTNLPLVDKNSQNTLRRRIVYQHLNKVLPDLLQSLGLSSMSIGSDVRLLVNSFTLQANNIMFKPIQWTLIALIFIKLLSYRDTRLDFLLKQAVAYDHMQLLLLSYKLDDSYLNRMISWLTDIYRLLDKTDDKQLTL